MKYLKRLGLAAMSVMALTAFLGVVTASAASLQTFTVGGNDKLGIGTVVEATLEKETSTLLEDAFGFTSVTCTGSTLKSTIYRTTTEKGPVGFPDETTGNPRGKISTLDFSPCGHTVDVEANGELEIRNIAGTTNGTVFSIGTRVKMFNTLLNQNCTANTQFGTDIGTLTGAHHVLERATLDINGLIPLEGCSASSARWTGKYEVTIQFGLTVESS
jgi:hypothetical protein